MASKVKVGVPRLLTIREVARVTGVAQWRWYETIAQGKGPPVVKFGKTFRISEKALAQWLEAQARLTPKAEPLAQPNRLTASSCNCCLRPAKSDQNRTVSA